MVNRWIDVTNFMGEMLVSKGSQESTLEKVEIYILSLWFLFFLIIVVTVKVDVCFGNGCHFNGGLDFLRKNVVPVISLIFLLAGAISYFRFNRKIEGSSNTPEEIIEIEDVNYEHLTFLTTYIIPLICFNLADSRYIFSLAILLFVIGIIYVRTDKFYANPTLAVLGYRLYKVDTKSFRGQRVGVVVLTRDALSKGDIIKCRHLDNKICYARKP